MLHDVGQTNCGAPPHPDAYVPAYGVVRDAVEAEVEDATVVWMERLVGSWFAEDRTHRIAGRLPKVEPIAPGGVLPTPADAPLP